ncbi:MAG: hypothetical protein RI531_04625 [Haloferacaceae archaeon]|nr:hypothetical protein [Haloferacaceae archaeon]
MLDSGGFIYISGMPVSVTHGPPWIANILYNPPSGLTEAIIGIAIMIISVAYIQYKRVGLPPQIKQDIAANGLIVGSIAICTIVLSMFSLSYTLRVTGGSIIGFMFAVFIQRQLDLR